MYLPHLQLHGFVTSNPFSTNCQAGKCGNPKDKLSRKGPRKSLALGGRRPQKSMQVPQAKITWGKAYQSAVGEGLAT